MHPSVTTHDLPRPLRGVLRCVAAFSAVCALTAGAQPFPDRPIKLVSPSPPGGGTDTTARLVAGKITELAQWQFVIDTRTGAGGNIGLDYVAKAAPDGYTIVMGETSNLTVNQYLFKSLPFDPERDLAPVALVGTGALVFVVASGKPWQSMAEVVAASKKAPLTYASSGNGTVGHLVSESFKLQSGAQMVHVPYKGAGPAMTDLLGGQVDVYFSSLTGALPMIKAGKVRALAVTPAQRVPQLSNVPTLIEAGYKGLDYYVFYGVAAPARTPPAVLQAMNREVNRALQTPELRDALAERGVEVRITPTAQDFHAFLAKERAKWQRVVKESGATVD